GLGRIGERLALGHAGLALERRALHAGRARVEVHAVLLVEAAGVALEPAALARLAVGAAVGRDRRGVRLVLGELRIAESALAVGRLVRPHAADAVLLRAGEIGHGALRGA